MIFRHQGTNYKTLSSEIEESDRDWNLTNRANFTLHYENMEPVQHTNTYKCREISSLSLTISP
jgi:hypothetical protein